MRRRRVSNKDGVGEKTNILEKCRIYLQFMMIIVIMM